ncbi:MAG: TfoX/Sxy family protein [Myxococcales bacterium]
MAYDEKMAARVRRLLSRQPNVAEKRMVGGLSFLLSGKLCCGVTRDGLMVRVGPGDYQSALARPHVRPMVFAGRSLAAFVCVEPSGVRSDAALAAWVRRGLDFAATLPDGKPRAKRLAAEDADFAKVVAALANEPGVTVGGGKGFGSSGLKVNGKLFALISSKGRFVAKLPRERVDELVRQGKGEPFDPGHGRKMKEWIALRKGAKASVALAREAYRYVRR